MIEMQLDTHYNNITHERTLIKHQDTSNKTKDNQIREYQSLKPIK